MPPKFYRYKAAYRLMVYPDDVNKYEHIFYEF